MHGSTWMRGASVLGVSLFAAFTGCADAPPADPPAACAKGSVSGPDGACMPVGIQGCAAELLGDDGLCRPAPERCPQGTIPKFDEGCVPVGIPGCAAGFLGEDGLCEPAMAKCPMGTYALPDAGCVPVDGPEGCGDGTWGSIPDGPDTIYVDATAADGGDGTKAKPLRTLAAAIAAAPSGGRVALAAGEYEEPAVLEKPLSLVGRCPSMVAISGTTDQQSVPAIVLVRETAGVVVEGVRIGGTGVGVFVLDAGVSLRRVAIDGASPLGVLATGAATAVSLERAFVANTAPRASDGKLGYGMQIDGGGELTILESAIVGHRDVGVVALGTGTTLRIDRSLVADTLPRANEAKSGRGVELSGGATGELVRCAISGNREAGVRALGAGTVVAVEDGVLVANGPEADVIAGGRGLELRTGASGSLLRTALVRNRGFGASAFEPGTKLLVERSLVAETLPIAGPSPFGFGVEVDGGASASLVDAAVVRNTSVGAAAAGKGTSLSLERSLVAGTRAAPGTERFGRGVEIGDGAMGTLAGSAVVGNRDVAVLASGDDATLTVDASLVADTLPQASDGYFGQGLHWDSGAKGALRASAVLGNQRAGVTIVGGLELVVERSLVADTRADPDGTYGVGVLCSNAALAVEGTVVVRSVTAGVLLSTCDATLTGSTVHTVAEGGFHTYFGAPGMQSISGTFDGIGDGLVGGADSNVNVAGLVVRGASRCGMVFDSSGGVLRGVDAAESRIGLVVQGAVKPDYSDDSNAFVGSEGSVVTDGALPVPGPPSIPID